MEKSLISLSNSPALMPSALAPIKTLASLTFTLSRPLAPPILLVCRQMRATVPQLAIVAPPVSLPEIGPSLGFVRPATQALDGLNGARCGYHAGVCDKRLPGFFGGFQGSAGSGSNEQSSGLLRLVMVVKQTVSLRFLCSACFSLSAPSMSSNLGCVAPSPNDKLKHVEHLIRSSELNVDCLSGFQFSSNRRPLFYDTTFSVCFK